MSGPTYVNEADLPADHRGDAGAAIDDDDLHMLQFLTQSTKAGANDKDLQKVAEAAGTSKLEAAKAPEIELDAEREIAERKKIEHGEVAERGENNNKTKKQGHKRDNFTQQMVGPNPQDIKKKANFYGSKKGNVAKDDEAAADAGASKKKPNKHNKRGGGDESEDDDEGFVCKASGMCFNTLKQLEAHYKKNPQYAPHNPKDDVPVDVSPEKGQKIKKKMHGHRGF